MTPSDKAYYSDGYWPLFKLMSDEFGLTLLEQDMSEIMNCVRKMDEARGVEWPGIHAIEKMTIQEARERHFPNFTEEDLERLANSYKDREDK